jgi:hypothetical protein
MKKNLAVVFLFVFLCISLFLNLAAWGERIRLNGTISELNEVVVYDLEYVKSVDYVREHLASYAWHADRMIDFCISSNKKYFDENRFYKMTDFYNINQATASAKQIKDQRSSYINNAKYIDKIN